MKAISDTTKELERSNIDTGRFLTVFEISMQSTKKIKSADIVAGVSCEAGGELFLVTKKVDPNKSHPYFRKEILQKIGMALRGIKFTSHTFDAIVWHRKYKENDRFCWKNNKGNTFQYSQDVISSIKSLTKEDIELSLHEYKKRKETNHSS